MRTIAMATVVPLFAFVAVTIASEICLLANMSVAPVVFAAAVIVAVVVVVVVMPWGRRIRKDVLAWNIFHSLPS
jgi:hypothetical protein